MKQNILNGIVGASGLIISFLFGGWHPLLNLFFFVIILDYISGISAAIITNQGLSSAVGYRGLIKKFSMICIVALSHQIDKVMGTDLIMYGSLYFFVANEMISIVENYGRMNLPLPERLKNIIKVLKERE